MLLALDLSTKFVMSCDLPIKSTLSLQSNNFFAFDKIPSFLSS